MARALLTGKQAKMLQNNTEKRRGTMWKMLIEVAVVAAAEAIVETVRRSRKG